MVWPFSSNASSSASVSDTAGASSPQAGTPAPQQSASEKWEATVKEEQIIQAAYTPLEEMKKCYNLFDEWAACYALIPQLNSAYRYGAPRDCSTKYNDWKFCLTLKDLSAQQRREKWLRHRAEQVAKMRLEGSSEDFWELRREPLVDPTFLEEPTRSET